MNSWHHAQSAARKWGGEPEDYLAIEEFIDSSKQIIGDVRHRSMYHHTAGVYLCQRIFGTTITVGRRRIPVRLIAERHILEDLGWLPSPADYIAGMPIKAWMSGSQRREVPLSVLLGEDPTRPDGESQAPGSDSQRPGDGSQAPGSGAQPPGAP